MATKQITAKIWIKTADDDHCSVQCSHIRFGSSGPKTCSLTSELFLPGDIPERTNHCKDSEKSSDEAEKKTFTFSINSYGEPPDEFVKILVDGLKKC